MILGGSPLATIPVDGSDEDEQTDEVFLIASPSPAPPTWGVIPHIISVVG